MKGARLEKVVVFGATSAMAEAIVRLLARRGAELVLVGRNAERLEAVASDARARGAARVLAILADLDDAERHEALVEEAAHALGRIDAAVVAQGLLADSAACEADPSLASRVLATNAVGPILLGERIARRLADQGSGMLVGISSVAGDRGRQSNHVYGAAKSAYSSYLDGLRNRLFRRGVHVITVKPGFVNSPMTAKVPKNALFAEPASVARTILRAMERRLDVVYVPGFWRLIMLLVRGVPERLFKRMRM